MPKLTDEPAFHIPITEMSDDWLRAARLKKAAQEGDEEAQKELDRMEDEVLISDRDLS